MNLNRNVWYVHLFFWSLGIWGAFRDNDGRYDCSRMEDRGTNLCFFVRVLVVYMPLVLLLHVVFAGVLVASLTVLPVYLFGSIAYGWTLASTAVVVGTFWGVGVALRYAKHAARRKPAQVKVVELKHEEKLAPKAAEAPKGPSFFEVLWAYLVAAKKKICPLITFIASKETLQ